MDKSIPLSTSMVHILTLMLKPRSLHLYHPFRRGCGPEAHRGVLFPSPLGRRRRTLLHVAGPGGAGLLRHWNLRGDHLALGSPRSWSPRTLVIVEPNPECFRRTRHNLDLNQFRCRIIPRDVALGAKRGSARMRLPSRDNARSTLNDELASWYAESGEKCGEFEVQVDTLDDMIEDGLPVPQFVKIDTECHEFDVLRGAERTLRRHRPELMVEIHGTTHEHWIRNRQNVQRFVTDCGYSVFDLHLKPVLETDLGTYLYCKSA